MSNPRGKKSAETVPPRQGSRRPRGAGGLYHDANRDRWIGTVTIAGRRHKISAKTKTDAEARLRRLTAARTTDTPVDDRAHTVAQAVATFLDRELPERTRRGRPLAETTVERERWCCDHIASELGAVRLATLTVEDVEAMLDRLAARPMSAASLRKVRGTLQRVIDSAQRRRKVSRNVALDARLPAKLQPPQSCQALTPDAARRLLDALHGEPCGLMFALSLRLGLRPGEAAALTWADVDGNALHVRRGLRMVKRRPVVVDDLKTAGSERSIELPADVAAWIDEHRRSMFGDVIPLRLDGVLMFPTAARRPWQPSNSRRLLAAICERAGIPAVRPNELRHSCASLLSDLGVPNEAIADLLGHTTTRMVEATYRHRLRPVVDVAARADWTAGR
jgi:integrase